MSADMTVEQRLAVLEEQVAELRQRFDSSQRSNTWLDRVAGSFRDQPEFDEVLRLGREIRQADRPAADSQSEP